MGSRNPVADLTRQTSRAVWQPRREVAGRAIPPSAYPGKAVQAGESAKVRVKFSPARGRVSPAFLRRSAATPGFPYAVPGRRRARLDRYRRKGVFRSSRPSVWPQVGPLRTGTNRNRSNINNVARTKKERGRGHNHRVPVPAGESAKNRHGASEKEQAQKEHVPERTKTGTS